MSYIQKILTDRLEPGYLERDWPLPLNMAEKDHYGRKVLFPKDVERLRKKIFGFKYF